MRITRIGEIITSGNISNPFTSAPRLSMLRVTARDRIPSRTRLDIYRFVYTLRTIHARWTSNNNRTQSYRAVLVFYREPPAIYAGGFRINSIFVFVNRRRIALSFVRIFIIENGWNPNKNVFAQLSWGAPENTRISWTRVQFSCATSPPLHPVNR